MASSVTTPGRREAGLAVVAVGVSLALGFAVAQEPLIVAALLSLGLVLALASVRLLGPSLTFAAVLTSCASGIELVGVLTLPDVFLLPAGALAAGTVLFSRRPLPIPSWWALPASGILVLGLLSAFFIEVPTFRYLFQFVGFLILVPLAVATYSTTSRRLTVFAAAYLASATINAGLAVLDAQGIWTIASQLTNFTGYEFSGRYKGLSNHSNQLGLMSVMGIPFALYFAGRWRPAAVTIPVLILGVASSGSRGGLLGLPLAFCLYILVTRRHVLKRLSYTAASLALGLFVAVSLGLSVGVARLFGEDGDSTALASDAARLEHLDRALSDLSQYPFTGVGYGLPNAHNLYLEIARAGGVVAGILFVAFVVGALRSGFASARALPLVAAPWASSAVWLLLAVQHNALFERFLYVPIGLIVGAAVMIVCRRPGSDLVDEDARQRPGPTSSVGS